MSGVPGSVSGAQISEVIAEFSEIFTSARSSWVRFAENVHPDVSGVAVMVLHFIVRRGPVTATDICQVLQMDKAMVSRQVAKLRELGFVVSSAAPGDRRVQLLVGSVRAVELMGELRALWASSYRERFAGWSGGELEGLIVALRRFNAS